MLNYKVIVLLLFCKYSFNKNNTAKNWPLVSGLARWPTVVENVLWGSGFESHLCRMHVDFFTKAPESTEYAMLTTYRCRVKPILNYHYPRICNAACICIWFKVLVTLQKQIDLPRCKKFHKCISFCNTVLEAIISKYSNLLENIKILNK